MNTHIFSNSNGIISSFSSSEIIEKNFMIKLFTHINRSKKEKILVIK